MIVDTSALVAFLFAEDGWDAIGDALSSGSAVMAAPTVTEFHLVSAGRSEVLATEANRLIDTMIADGMEVVPFEHRHATITATARERYGKGNGRGGLLNYGDLIVYAIAKQRGEPLLCTGRDFASTDLKIHPASRIDP